MEFTEILSLLTQPINLAIFILGIITLCVNIICLHQACKRHDAIKKDMKKISQESALMNPGDKLPMETTMHWATSGQYNNSMKTIIAGLRCIEKIHQKDVDDGNNENRLRNIYSGSVEILPLCGIWGTLYAIFKQTIAQGNIVATDIQANFGLAITSTLIALFFTAINIFIEGFYLHKIEFVDNYKSTFAAVKFLPPRFSHYEQENNNR